MKFSGWPVRKTESLERQSPTKADNLMWGYLIDAIRRTNNDPHTDD